MAWLGGQRHEGSTARQWRRDESGAVAITVAFAALVMVVIAGAAIDMGIYVLRREQVSAAVDAALTSAVSAAYRTEAEGKSVEQSAAAGSDAGKALYAANTTAAPDVEDKTLTLELAKKTVGSLPNWVGSASVNGSFTTYFLKIIGVKTLPIRVSAASAVSIKTSRQYWEFTIAADTSQSMGIPSTVAGMNRMLAHDKCFFACHEAGANTRMSELRKLGIDFRIDAVSRAVSAMAGSIKQSMDGNAKVAIYSFDREVRSTLDMTSDLEALATLKIDLPIHSNGSYGVTNFDQLFLSLNNVLTPAGDGSSAKSPKRAVFLITDGVHDSQQRDVFTKVSSGLHYMAALPPSLCQELKDKGIVVSVLYVTYFIPKDYKMPGNAKGFEDLVDSLKPNLEACASSPKLFFQAGESEGIKAALQDMLKAVTGSGNVRLTN